MRTTSRSDGLKRWNEIVGLSAAYLQRQGVPDAQIAAELLSARLLKCGRGFLAPHLAREASEPHLEAMRRGMARLAKGEPIQYVLGEWDFRSLTLTCDRRALIPRPETEELVERVLRHVRRGVPSAANGRPFIVDVGTGSGCIILSLAKELEDGVFLGTDVSSAAVSLAMENAVRCGLDGKVRFAVTDGMDEFDPGTVDVIVSNPPYIASAECETLDPRVRDHEPRLALDGGANGLAFYERFVGDALYVLKPGGAVFFEIGESQGDALRQMLTGYGFSEVKVEKDFAGHDRYASGVLPG